MKIRWKRPESDFVYSHCGHWSIWPVYTGCGRPKSYDLRHWAADGWRVVSNGSTQRECKEAAQLHLVVLLSSRRP